MVFITAGMGGGTGTGAGPIIAKCARERGILTVGVVTKPFHFEGRHRMRLADAGIAELQRYVDTLIVIPNQNLFRVANERTTFAEAFAMADQVLHSGVRSITDLMVLPGLINLDFADVRTVMTEMGKAMMGTGEATGEGRALMAAENAIQNPLLDEVSLKGAKAVLVNITGGLDMTLLEVDEAANAISAQVDPEANIIFGAAFDPSLDDTLRVSVVATGMDGSAHQQLAPQAQSAGPVSGPGPTARTVAALRRRSARPSRRASPSRSARPRWPAPPSRRLASPRSSAGRPGQACPVRPPADRSRRRPARARAGEAPRHRRPPRRHPRAPGEAARDASADRPIARIVDPSVEDEEDLNQGDLYMDPPAPHAQPAITAPRTYARPAEPRRPEARRAELQPEAPTAERPQGRLAQPVRRPCPRRARADRPPPAAAAHHLAGRARGAGDARRPRDPLVPAAAGELKSPDL